MPKGEKLTLEQNLPVRGTVLYVDYAASEHGDQIRVTGKFQQAVQGDDGPSWADRGAAHFYLPTGALRAFVDAGVVSRPVDGETDRFGNPKYHVKSQRTPLEVLRKQVSEDGQKKVITVVRLLDADGRPITPAAPTAGAEKDAGPKKVVVTGGAAPIEAPVAVARRQWALVDEAVTAATAIAARALKRALALEDADVDQEALAKLTATVLIRAEHYGVQSAVGMTRNGDAPKGPDRPAARPAAAAASPAKAAAVSAPATSAPAELDEFPAAADDEAEDDDLPF